MISISDRICLMLLCCCLILTVIILVRLLLAVTRLISSLVLYTLHLGNLHGFIFPLQAIKRSCSI